MFNAVTLFVLVAILAVAMADVSAFFRQNAEDGVSLKSFFSERRAQLAQQHSGMIANSKGSKMMTSGYFVNATMSHGDCSGSVSTVVGFPIGTCNDYDGMSSTVHCSVSKSKTDLYAKAYDNTECSGSPMYNEKVESYPSCHKGTKTTCTDYDVITGTAGLKMISYGSDDCTTDINYFYINILGSCIQTGKKHSVRFLSCGSGSTVEYKSFKTPNCKGSSTTRSTSISEMFGTDTGVCTAGEEGSYYKVFCETP